MNMLQDPKGMSSSMILGSHPSGAVMVFHARWELEGLSASGNSTSVSVRRPMARSCSSTDSAFQTVR